MKFKNVFLFLIIVAVIVELFFFIYGLAHQYGDGYYVTIFSLFTNIIVILIAFMIIAFKEKKKQLELTRINKYNY